MSKKFYTSGRLKRPYFKTPQKKESLFILFNLIILVSTIVVAAIDIKYGTSDGQDGASVSGWDFLRPFTIDSNILMAIAAAIALIKTLRHSIVTARKNNASFMRPFGTKFTNFYFLSVVSIDLTFVVVTLFLAPLRLMHGQNGASMFMGDMLFFHLINPIAATCALFLFNGAAVNRLSELLCYLPMAIYSTVYGVHVLFIGDWEDFYNFTFDGDPFLSTISVFANILIIHYITRTLARFYSRRMVDSTSHPYQDLKYKQPR